MITPPNPQPLYLSDVNGNAWLAAVTNAGIPDLLGPATVPDNCSLLPFTLLNDIVTGSTWRLIVLPSPANPTYPTAAFHYDPWATQSGQSGQSGLPTQLLVSAPNGVVYALQISNGVMQSTLPSPSSYNCSTTISQLAGDCQDRMEEPRGPGIFWDLQTEVYTALVEAMNETMMLVGRPTQSVSVPFNLTPNTVWQHIPKGIYLITDIIGARSALRRMTLFDADFVQSSWGPSWECDTSPLGPVRWFPIGMTMFAVHPAPSVPITVTLNAIQYPVAEAWPYNGSETVPFQHEFHVMLEEYAAGYLRLKEIGAEAMEGVKLYDSFLKMAQRMTLIQDRRDPLIFSPTYGAVAGLNPLVRR